MKKNHKVIGLLACLGLMLPTQNINAQTVSDFENLTLSPNTYFDGSDMLGTHNAGIFTTTFISGDASYLNVYDTTFSAAYGYWSEGFAYSNMTDSITSGAGNKFSSRAGSGYNNSDNYVVANNNSTIILSGAAANNTVSGFFISNSTYAANSMRDGDSFAKQFGGTSGNDADWFLLTIKGYTGGNLTTDSVDFYLADYRFSNNAQDYIVKDWRWIDLTFLGAVDSLYFSLSSSDVGSFGMNTPSFFCMDNFNDQSVGTKELTFNANFYFYPNPAQNSINIKLEKAIDFISIIDVTGKTVFTASNLNEGINQLNISELTSGIYFIKANNSVQRFIKN
jgi:hypothetical protein